MKSTFRQIGRTFLSRARVTALCGGNGAIFAATDRRRLFSVHYDVGKRAPTILQKVHLPSLYKKQLSTSDGVNLSAHTLAAGPDDTLFVGSHALVLHEQASLAVKKVFLQPDEPCHLVAPAPGKRRFIVKHGNKHWSADAYAQYAGDVLSKRRKVQRFEESEVVISAFSQVDRDARDLSTSSTSDWERKTVTFGSILHFYAVCWLSDRYFAIFPEPNGMLCVYDFDSLTLVDNLKITSGFSGLCVMRHMNNGSTYIFDSSVEGSTVYRFRLSGDTIALEGTFKDMPDDWDPAVDVWGEYILWGYGDQLLVFDEDLNLVSYTSLDLHSEEYVTSISCWNERNVVVLGTTAGNLLFLAMDE